MTYRVVMFLFGFTQDYSVSVFNILVAVWFMAVGYLLVKNINRRVRARASRLAVSLPAESFVDAGQEHVLQRG
jgi:hypothetical protein